MTHPTQAASAATQPDTAEGLLREYMAFVATTCISFPKLEDRARRLLASTATAPSATTDAKSAAPAGVGMGTTIDGYLCRAWGESDEPIAELVLDLEGVASFMVECWLGDEDATAFDGSLILPSLKEEWAAREWKDEPPWSLKFEIGGVSVEKITLGLPVAAPSAQDSAAHSSVSAEPGVIYDRIKEVLEHYRLSSAVDDFGDPFPLVDALSTPGGSIASGKDEIVFICDAIYNEVLLPLAPPAPAAAPQAGEPVARVIDEFEQASKHYAMRREDIAEWIARIRAATPSPAVSAGQPKLKVWLTKFPESNGKTNWTALLVREEKWDGLVGNCGGISLARGELWNRVAYEAECAKYLLGQRDTEPYILDYGDDIKTPEEWKGETHGGRATPSPSLAQPQPGTGSGND